MDRTMQQKEEVELVKGEKFQKNWQKYNTIYYLFFGVLELHTFSGS